MIYTTVDGEVLDAICHAHYGHLYGVVERVLELNPGLSYSPPAFEAGVKIELPELEIRGGSQATKLWS